MKHTKRKSAAADATQPVPEQKVTATPAGCDSTVKHVVAEESAMHNASGETKATSDTAAPSETRTQENWYALAPSCTVRDSVALKSALLDLLMNQRPVTIDTRAVERIDTAALQVLCAFVRDRKAAGGEVLWLGCTESFSEAIRLLGLQQVLGVPDALLAEAAA